jgi:hypothetical protein
LLVPIYDHLCFLETKRSVTRSSWPVEASRLMRIVATKKAGPNGPAESAVRFFLCADHACGDVLLAPGDATGGHGLPGVGLIPGVVGEVPPPFGLPGVDGFELDDPAFGVVLDVPFVVPGRVPHGEPLGELPGFVGVLGLMVDGCVVPPGVGAVGEFDPGTVVFGVPLGDVAPGVLCGVVVPAGGVAVPAGGAAVVAGGVAVPAGGVAVLAGGVAGDPGVDVCPADPDPAGGTAPPEGVDCAMAQLAQPSTTESNTSFDFDI